MHFAVQPFGSLQGVTYRCADPASVKAGNTHVEGVCIVTQEERTAQIEQWADMVYRLALARSGNTQDAEDIFQEVFERFFRSESKLTDDEHRKAWLISCTINRCKSLHTSAWRKHIVPLETAAKIGIPDDDREVYAAVLSLPDKYRTVIHLHYYEDLSVADIARALQVAEGTVKSQLSRARNLLREELRDIEL